MVASRAANGAKEISFPFRFSIDESSWLAARVQSVSLRPGLEIWAHSNPVYVLKDGKPVYVRADREAVREQWKKEAEFYRTAGSGFRERATAYGIFSPGGADERNSERSSASVARGCACAQIAARLLCSAAGLRISTSRRATSFSSPGCSVFEVIEIT